MSSSSAAASGLPTPVPTPLSSRPASPAQVAPVPLANYSRMTLSDMGVTNIALIVLSVVALSLPVLQMVPALSALMSVSPQTLILGASFVSIACQIGMIVFMAFDRASFADQKNELTRQHREQMDAASANFDERLQQLLESSNKQLEALKEKYNATEARAQTALEAQEKAHGEEMQGLHETMGKIQDEASKVSEELIEAEKELAVLNERVANLEHQLEESNKLLAAHVAMGEEHVELRTRLQNESSESQGRIQQLQEDLQVLQKEHTNLSRQYALAQQELREKTVTLQTTEGSLYQERAAKAKLETEVAELSAQVQKLSDELTAIHESRQTTLDKIGCENLDKTVIGYIEALHKVISELEKKLQEEKGQLGDYKQAMSELRVGLADLMALLKPLGVKEAPGTIVGFVAWAKEALKKMAEELTQLRSQVETQPSPRRRAASKQTVTGGASGGSAEGN